jgi:hypothetical protein
MWFARIFGSRSVFTPLERRLLGELQSRLAPEAAQLLAQQLERVTLVQRHMQSQEICCHPKRGVRIYHDPALAFPVDTQELKLATLRFKRPGERQVWKAEFWVVNRHFFSINFWPGAQPVQQTDAIEVQSIEIHHDPMQAMPAIETPADVTTSDTPHLRALRDDRTNPQEAR